MFGRVGPVDIQSKWLISQPFDVFLFQKRDVFLFASGSGKSGKTQGETDVDAKQGVAVSWDVVRMCEIFQWRSHEDSSWISARYDIVCVIFQQKNLYVANPCPVTHPSLFAMETRRQHGPFQKNQEVEVKQEVSKAIRLSEEAAEQPKILPFILSEKAVGCKCDVLKSLPSLCLLRILTLIMGDVHLAGFFEKNANWHAKQQINPCKVDFKGHDPMKEPQFSEAEIFMGTWGGCGKVFINPGTFEDHVRCDFCRVIQFFLGVMYVVSDVWSQCCHHRSLYIEWTQDGESWKFASTQQPPSIPHEEKFQMWFHLIFVRKFRLRLHRQLLLMVRSFWMSSFVRWSFWMGTFISSTLWKINMEPTNHSFRKEHDLSNLHDYVPCLIFRGVSKSDPGFQKENLCFRKMVNQKGGGGKQTCDLYLRPWLLPFSAGFHDGLGCHAYGTHWSMEEGGPSLRYSKFLLHKLQEVTPQSITS